MSDRPPTLPPSPPPPAPPAAPVPPYSEPAGVAAYIADMVTTLAAMARRHKFDALGYLLEMARLEAQTLAKSERPRRSE